MGFNDIAGRLGLEGGRLLGEGVDPFPGRLGRPVNALDLEQTGDRADSGSLFPQIILDDLGEPIENGRDLLARQVRRFGELFEHLRLRASLG